MANPFSAYNTILAFFTAAMTKTTPLTFRVVSYNVLSSHLASPSHFSTLDPQHLDASARLPKILDKLDEQIAKRTDEPVIFCLQEISYQWAGKLHTFFANRGFHVVTGLYGKPFNGYMGVLTAWPTADLETVDVNISRLSDTVKWPRATDEGSSIVRSLYDTTIRKPLQWMGLTKSSPESHWSIAQRRSLKLQTFVSSCLLTIAHHPARSGLLSPDTPQYVPMVMTMHADMCIGWVQALAEDRPYVVAGDFNLKPSESVFRYLTSCKMAETDHFFPTPFQNDPTQPWKPTMKEPVRSAYSVCNDGKEPDFTNYARIREDEPFIDTLDYIFVSDCVEPISVQTLPVRENAGGPFPNELEPSDHIMITATMKLTGRKM